MSAAVRIPLARLHWPVCRSALRVGFWRMDASLRSHLGSRTTKRRGGTVNSNENKLDKAFIERQRERLTKLREELSAAVQGKAAEEKDINSQSDEQVVEHGDDAQRLAALELDSNLIARNEQRLAQVDRALQKIAEGTYGLSDESENAIPKERLEATPEATYTLE